MTPLRRIVPVFLALLLAACSSQPVERGNPALWEVAAPDGTVEGYLFGTIHALPDSVAWQGPALDAAIERSDLLLLEIADPAEAPPVFAELATTPGQPPLAERVAPDLRADVRRVQADLGLDDARFADKETWAAAVILANSLSDGDRANGVERALLAAFASKPVEEVEGARAQLALFDRLPEAAQRRLLAAVVKDAADPRRDPARLRRAWLRADLAAIERESARGFLADAQLREVLLDGRNRAWVPAIEARFAEHGPVFVAVGGGHMVGEAGLPALLEARGYAVRRVD